MNTEIIRKELAIGTKPVRILLEGQIIWLCVHDLCKVMSRPQFMLDNPVFTMCPSAQKLKFSKDKDAIWGILRGDVEKYFYLIRKESGWTAAKYKQVVNWAKSLTPEIIVNAPGVTHRTNKPTSTAQSQEVTVYQYNNTNISFLTGVNTSVNAIEMAKAFGKVPKDWLRTNQAQEFINSLSAVRQISPTELVKVKQGGNGAQGTWVHEDVAIEFARWLSPAFAIWCNDRIKELLNHGVTAMPDTIDKMIADPSAAIQMLQALQKERAAKELAISERDEARQVVVTQKPKADYYDAVIESRPIYTTCQVAAELGMCYITLRTKLAKLGVVTSVKGDMLLTPGHEDWGEMVRIDGPKQRSYLKWNKTGREQIFALINPNLPT